MNEGFYNENCISGAKSHIASNSIDLIISDPPYGIDGSHLDKHYNRNEDFVIDGYVEVPAEEYGQFSHDWITEAARILKPGGSIYIVSGYSNLHHVLNALHSTDLKEINHIIWKYNFGVHTSKKYVSSHYHILYWQKPGGNPVFNTYCRYGDSEKDEDGSSLNYKDREDVFIINREYKPGEIKNKNELPFALLSKLISYSSNEGDTVLDMFLGGGSTAIVAKGLNRTPMGFEISEKAFKISMERIDSVEKGSLLTEIRRPEKNLLLNRGKSWTEEEHEAIRKIIENSEGESKKAIIEKIGKELGRGRFAVVNELEKMGIEIKTDGRGRLKGSKNKEKESVINKEQEPKTATSLDDYA